MLPTTWRHPPLALTCARTRGYYDSCLGAEWNSTSRVFDATTSYCSLSPGVVALGPAVHPRTSLNASTLSDQVLGRILPCPPEGPVGTRAEVDAIRGSFGPQSGQRYILEVVVPSTRLVHMQCLSGQGGEASACDGCSYQDGRYIRKDIPADPSSSPPQDKWSPVPRLHRACLPYVATCLGRWREQAAPWGEGGLRDRRRVHDHGRLPSLVANDVHAVLSIGTEHSLLRLHSDWSCVGW